MPLSAALIVFSSVSLFAQSIVSLREAAALHPDDVKAHLDLGIAYLTLSHHPDGERAEPEFRRALELDPNNISALLGLATSSYWSLKFDEARSWCKRVLAVKRSSEDAYYLVGVIAWRETSLAIDTRRHELGMKPDNEGWVADASVRKELTDKYFGVIKDGIENVNHALELNPYSARTKVYKGLLLWERAALRDSKKGYEADEARAGRLIPTCVIRSGRPPASSPYYWMPPTPFVPHPPELVAQRVRVGPDVQAANLLKKVEPVYPPEAVETRVEGTVQFTVIIGKDGKVQDIQLIRGNALLVPAAKKAVTQYIYKPVTLNGDPIQVVTTVDVVFALRD